MQALLSELSEGAVMASMAACLAVHHAGVH